MSSAAAEGNRQHKAGGHAVLQVVAFQASLIHVIGIAYVGRTVAVDHISGGSAADVADHWPPCVRKQDRGSRCRAALHAREESMVDGAPAIGLRDDAKQRV